MDYSKAFKAYDIRNIYKDVIDEKFAYYMGLGIGKYGIKEYGIDCSFLLGKDPRPANDSLMIYFISGLYDAGISNIAKVVYSGIEVISTAALYSIGWNNFDIGVAFTASHNPKEYVGMKMFTKDLSLFDTELLKQLFFDVYKDEIPTLNSFSCSVIDEQSDVILKLKEKLNTRFLKISKKYKFVVDYSHGAGTTFERDFIDNLRDLGHTIIELNDYPDGTFPAHESDTSNFECYEQLSEAVKENSADFGVMFDGDVDRVGFVSNSGKVVFGDIITAIIANSCLQEKPNSLILYDCMSTHSIREVVEKQGGTAHITKVGRFFINKELQNKGAIFAGELSGHYLFAEMGGCEMPLLAMYYVIDALQQCNDFDSMIANYYTTFKSEIINKTVLDPDKKLAELETYYANYEIKHIDGVNVYGADFWITARKSNTEPKIRVVYEAYSQEAFSRVGAEIESIFSY